MTVWIGFSCADESFNVWMKIGVWTDGSSGRRASSQKCKWITKHGVTYAARLGLPFREYMFVTTKKITTTDVTWKRRALSCWYNLSLGIFALLTLHCLLVGRCAHAGGSLDRPITLNIPANTRLEDALIEWGTKAGMTVMINTAAVANETTVGVRGTLPAGKALAMLLLNSGLSYTEDGGRIRIAPLRTLVPSAQREEQLELPSSSFDAQIKPLREGATQVKADPALTRDESDVRPKDLAEVVVTAEKRSELLQDVPVPMTAISSDTLVDSNKFRLEDYYSDIPGLSMTPSTFNAASLSIRGITTGDNTNPTVGILVDDVPFGPSTRNGGGSVQPEVDPSDLARVEVLRGPQGTLYGASSLGGLLKFVTVDPSTEEVSGRVQATTNSVHNGAELGYGFRGSINAPLSDTLAVLASGFTRRDPGYVDNIQTGQRGVNEADTDGGRLSALWRSSQDLSIKLSALLQSTTGRGVPNTFVGPDIGDLQQSYLRGTGGYNSKIQAYSAILTAKIGIVDLTALSGYNVTTFSGSTDGTYGLGSLTQTQFGVAGTPFVYENQTKKFTQEIRFSAPLGQRVDWLFGAFYTRENSQYLEDILAEDPTTGEIVGSWFHYSGPATYEEVAAFTDVTIHFTDRFDVQVGGRESQIRQTFSYIETGPLLFNGGVEVVVPEADSKDNAFTYLVTPRFKVSQNLMVYARLASGYRPGGPNIDSSLAGVSSAYKPDKTENYEVGVKGNALDHKVTFDASVYYIDWRNIQLSLSTPSGFTYYSNGSGAKSQGLEFSGELRPLNGMTIAGWVAWDDAVLTTALPDTSTEYGVSGARLPYSSRFSGSLSVEQDFPIASSLTGFIQGAVNYVGDRESEFTGPPPEQRQDLPAYARTDLRGGVRYASWTVNAFVNNLADRRGVFNGSEAPPPASFIYIQPRTVGVSIAKKF
jgi:iron complex outermembrane receptor protein